MPTLLSLQLLATTTEADSGRVLNKNASFGSENGIAIGKLPDLDLGVTQVSQVKVTAISPPH